MRATILALWVGVLVVWAPQTARPAAENAAAILQALSERYAFHEKLLDGLILSFASSAFTQRGYDVHPDVARFLEEARTPGIAPRLGRVSGLGADLLRCLGTQNVPFSASGRDERTRLAALAKEVRLCGARVFFARNATPVLGTAFGDNGQGFVFTNLLERRDQRLVRRAIFGVFCNTGSKLAAAGINLQGAAPVGAQVELRVLALAPERDSGEALRTLSPFVSFTARVNDNGFAFGAPDHVLSRFAAWRPAGTDHLFLLRVDDGPMQGFYRKAGHEASEDRAARAFLGRCMG